MRGSRWCGYGRARGVRFRAGKGRRDEAVEHRGPDGELGIRARMAHVRTRKAHSAGKTGRLPGLSRLGNPRQLAVTVSQVVAGVNVLKEPVARAGSTRSISPTLKGMVHKRRTRTRCWRRMSELLTELTAADPRLGKAYGLGRALADSCHEPDDFDGLKKELNPYRIANLLRWLDDLASAFPPHAAHSVATSLGRWRDALYPPNDWASAPPRIRGRNSTRGESAAAAREPINAKEPDEAEHAVKALRQTRRAMARAVVRTRSRDGHARDRQLSRRWQGACAPHGRDRQARRPAYAAVDIGVLALTGAGVWLLSEGSSSQLVAGATSVLAALGLTWKGLGGALGQLAGKLEQPLWGAVLDDAIADAITLLPDNNAETGGDARWRSSLARAKRQPVA